MRTKQVLWILLLGVLSPLAIEAEEPVRFGRLQLEVPADWAQRELNGTLALKPGPKTTVIVYPPVPLGDVAFQAGFEQLVTNLEKGWTTVKAQPTAVAPTGTGMPACLSLRMSRNEQGTTRFTLFCGLSVVDQVQMIALYAAGAEAFEATAPAVHPMLDGARLWLPLAETEPGELAGETLERRMVHASWRIPAGWHLWSNLLDGGNKQRFYFDPVPAVNHSMTVVFDLQARVPGNARRLLTQWLAGAPHGVFPAQGTERKVTWFPPQRLSNGLVIASAYVVDQAEGGWRAHRGGAIVIGEGWSFLLGSAVGNNEDWWELSDRQRATLASAWTGEVLPRLWAIACSLEWGKGVPQPDDELVEYLMVRKRYRYFSESEMGSLATTYVLRSEYSYWDFHADQTCDWKAASDFRVTMSSFGDSAHPYDPTSTLYAGDDKDAGTVKAPFSAVRLGDRSFLIVTEKTGYTHVHQVEIDKVGSFGVTEGFTGLAIDGHIEGRYAKGDWGAHRKPHDE